MLPINSRSFRSIIATDFDFAMKQNQVGVILS